jgi:hypothetical protein
MSNVSIHDNVVLLDHCDPTYLIIAVIIGVLLILYLATLAVLLRLYNMTT